MNEDRKFVAAEVEPGKKLIGRFATPEGAKAAATRFAERNDGTRAVAGEIVKRDEDTGRLKCKVILRAGLGVADGAAFSERPA